MFGISHLAGSIMAGLSGSYAPLGVTETMYSAYRLHPSAAQPSNNKYRPHQGKREKARRRLGCHDLFGFGKLPVHLVTPRQSGAFAHVWIDGKRPESVSRQVRHAEERRHMKALRARYRRETRAMRAEGYRLDGPSRAAGV